MLVKTIFTTHLEWANTNAFLIGNTDYQTTKVFFLYQKQKQT